MNYIQSVVMNNYIEKMPKILSDTTLSSWNFALQINPSQKIFIGGFQNEWVSNSSHI